MRIQTPIPHSVGRDSVEPAGDLIPSNPPPPPLFPVTNLRYDLPMPRRAPQASLAIALFAAGSLIAATAVVLLYLALQRYIVGGLTGGAVKG